jgi:hypothetical protein
VQATHYFRHSLNNQCELEGSGVVAGQGGLGNVSGGLWLMPTSGIEEKLGALFGTGCLLSAAFQVSATATVTC